MYATATPTNIIISFHPVISQLTVHILCSSLLSMLNCYGPDYYFSM
jgi:hypothetical protein